MSVTKDFGNREGSLSVDELQERLELEVVSKVVSTPKWREFEEDE